MIISLSNSFKAIALNDATKKLLFASAQSLSIPLRFKSVEEKVGLPAKPKKPINPYFRFANENRPSVVAKHPKLKSYEINSILGKMWQALEPADRENYTKDYKTDLIQYYSTEYTKYRLRLTDDDKRKIKEKKIEIKERRALAAQKRSIRKLKKPKKPMSSFFRFYKEQKDRKTDETCKVHVERVTSRWNDLSESEKEKYKTSAEEEATYKLALLQWEQKMLKLGQDDVVRDATKKIPKTRKPVAIDE